MKRWVKWAVAGLIVLLIAGGVLRALAARKAQQQALAAGSAVKDNMGLVELAATDVVKAQVRENISGRFTEWRAELDAFEGTTPELLAYCMNSWWERVGLTRASGLTKLMMSEAKNFPDIAAFYQQEVIMPGQALIRAILQRGMDRGEFRPMDLDYAVYLVVAPMIFLTLSRHSAGMCVSSDRELDPQKYIAFQVDTILNGISTPAVAARANRKAAA